MRVIVVTALCTLFLACSGHAQSPEDLAKVDAAIPVQPRKTPDAPRKLLVFTLCKGFTHSSIPLGVAALERMGQKTGAYSATVSDDPNVFRPESLAAFDAVCMLNTTGELFDDPALKKSLAAFVKSGKGLVGIHAATDCFYKWLEYGEMMGAYFDGHPWGAGDTVTCALEEPDHPLSAAFKVRGFSITDEIYQFQPTPFSRDKLRILVSLDVARTGMNKAGLKRADNDYPISWIQLYGQGRVFYCSLGHNESTYWNSAVLQHYLDGIQFAVGDIPADATPTNQLSPEQREESRKVGAQKIVEEAFKDLPQYAYGDDDAAVRLVRDWILDSHGDAKVRAEYEQRLIAALETASTKDARRQISSLLLLCATEESVPKLAALLTSADTSDEARYILERMTTETASAALRTALPLTEGLTRIGIINSLGERKDRDAVPLLAPYARADDPQLAESAQTALGKIGGSDAEKALLSALAVVTPQNAPPLIAACVSAALAREAKGERAAASAMYERMLELAPTTRCQVAALQGLAATNHDRAPAIIVAALHNPDAKVRAGAAVAARIVPGKKADKIFADALPELSAAAQVLLIGALADRGEPATVDPIANALSNPDPAVVKAAVTAIGRLGSASQVAVLADLAAHAPDDLASVARASLAAMRGENVDAAITAAIDPADAPVRRELVRALGARNARTSMPALLKTAGDPDETVRVAAYSALGALAGPDDLQPLVNRLAAEQSDAARAEAEKAVISVLERGVDPAQAAVIALSVLPEVKQGIPGYCAMLRVLGKIDDPSTLDALRAATQLRNAEVRATAIRALAEWKSTTPMAELLDFAKTSEDSSLRDIALRGYLRMLERPENTGNLIEQYGAALITARTSEERKVVMASIGTQSDPGLVSVVMPYAQDPEVKQEASLVLERLRKVTLTMTASHNSGEAARAIDGDPATRWSTLTPQKPDQWIEIDLGYNADWTGVTLDCGGSPGDYPRKYKVYVSQDKTWGDPTATGEGKSHTTEITFPPRRGRYLRIEQLGESDDLWWSIHELRVHVE